MFNDRHRPRPAGPLLPPILLAAALGMLSACHLPTPDARAVLRITASGEVTLDGAPVRPGDLNAALAARQAPGSHLLVQILAAPQADIALVKRAVEASKLAHASVAFAGDEQP
jgi:hypothetical protein